jgi:hypothetical protein
MIRFARIREDDSWGVRGPNLRPGQVVQVERRDGSLTTVTVGTIVWRARDGRPDVIARVQGAKPRPRRSRRRDGRSRRPAPRRARREPRAEPAAPARAEATAPPTPPQPTPTDPKTIRPRRRPTFKPETGEGS